MKMLTKDGDVVFDIELPDELLPEEKPFEVTDLASADWCMRTAAGAEERIAAREALVNDRIRKYRSWADEENRKDMATVERMAMLLKPWTEENKPEAVKLKKSLLKTPLSDHFKAKGEIPAGCEFVPKEERFYLEVI